MDKIPMTAAGYSVLETELKHRQQVERPRIIQQITDARTHGDLSENAEYHAAKESQSHNEGRIAELEDKLARAEVIDVSKLSGDTIKFGATVTLVDEDTDKKQVWQLVGEPEADAKKGRISITSPRAHEVLECRKIGLGLACEVHHREHGDVEAEQLLVEQSAVALDEASLLQRPHPAQAGRRRDADPARQLHIGHPAVVLQLLQDLPVDGVDAGGHAKASRTGAANG